MLLKELAETVADPLTRIFRRSLSEESVPADWKHANVMQTGGRADAASYVE